MQSEGRYGQDLAVADAWRNSENSKANRIETMKGPAESGQICSVGRRKIAKKIAKNKRQPRRAREKARTIELASPNCRSRKRVRLRPTRPVQSDPPPSGPSARCDTNDTKSMARDIVSIPKRGMSNVAKETGGSHAQVRFCCYGRLIRGGVGRVALDRYYGTSCSACERRRYPPYPDDGKLTKAAC